MASRPRPPSPETLQFPLRDSCDAADRVLAMDWPTTHEVVLVIVLNAQLHPIRTEWIGEGDAASVPLFTRRLLALVLTTDARAMVLAHNHPSGCLDPSAADLRLTRELARVLAAVEIRLLDHLIVSGDTWRSMRDDGLL